VPAYGVQVVQHLSQLAEGPPPDPKGVLGHGGGRLVPVDGRVVPVGDGPHRGDREDQEQAGDRQAQESSAALPHGRPLSDGSRLTAQPGVDSDTLLADRSAGQGT
jgi:hypothetical protein